MKLEEVIDQLAPATLSQQASYTGETFAEITKVYHEMYAGGLSAFFESNWFYFTQDGTMTFPREGRIVGCMASFLKALASSASGDQGHRAYFDNLETRAVWELAKTAYEVPPTGRTAPQAVLPSWTDPLEARQRVQVVEVLLSGEVLIRNPLTPPYQDQDKHRVRQFDFWYTLAELLRQRTNHYGQDATKIREDCLARMRSLLDGRENRDVLYSIAVVREMTPRYGSVDKSVVPQHVNETEPMSRFLVASKFITNEAQAEGGSTNVIRRLSKIAVHAHISPGVCAQT